MWLYFLSLQFNIFLSNSVVSPPSIHCPNCLFSLGSGDNEVLYEFISFYCNFISQNVPLYLKICQNISVWLCMSQCSFFNLKVWLYISQCGFISQNITLYINVWLYISKYDFISLNVALYVKIWLHISQCCFIYYSFGFISNNVTYILHCDLMFTLFYTIFLI